VMNEQYLKVLKETNEESLISLVTDLIMIESHKEIATEEKEIAEFIYNVLKREGIDVELDTVFNGRPNVYASIGNKSGGKKLMLNGHIDTVPAYDMVNPFLPVIKDERIYGRGAADMKAAIGAMIMTLIAIKRAGVPLNGELIFTGVIDEEKKCRGTERIVNKSFPFADYALIGEPTNLSIVNGHKGMEWIEVTIHGKSTHGCNPDKGVNAILKAAKFLDKIEEQLVPKLQKREHSVLGQPTLNVGLINGGVDPNVVPGECKIQIDRRWVPEENIESMQNDFLEVIADLKLTDGDFDAEVRRMSEAILWESHAPLYTPVDHPFTKALHEAVEIATNKQPSYSIFPGWTDGAQLSNAGITSLVCGPGDVKQAHSCHEFVEVSQISEALRTYIAAALKVCL